MGILEMNKKLGFSLALACILFADSAKAGNIGFINDPELAQKSTALQGLQMQREKMLAVLKIDVEKEAQKILEQKQELQGDRSGLSQEEVGKRLDEINKAEEDLKNRAQEAFVSLQKNYMEAAISVKEKAINPVVEALAKEKDFDAVLNAANAFYIQDGLDVTEEAVSRVNKKMPKVELKKVSLEKSKNGIKKEGTKKETSKTAKKSKSGKKSK